MAGEAEIKQMIENMKELEAAKFEIVEQVKELKTKYEENTSTMKDLQLHKAIAEHYAEEFNFVSVKQFVETHVNAKLYEAIKHIQQVNNTGKGKPILESKAISDLSLIDESRNCRAWNKKRKNALGQT